MCARPLITGEISCRNASNCDTVSASPRPPPIQNSRGLQWQISDSSLPLYGRLTRFWTKIIRYGLPLTPADRLAGCPFGKEPPVLHPIDGTAQCGGKTIKEGADRRKTPGLSSNCHHIIISGSGHWTMKRSAVGSSKTPEQTPDQDKFHP